jgi:phage host-nuclease inhibitor protein Gam
MDIETSDAIDAVRADVREVETSLREVEASLRTDIRTVESSLRGEIRHVESTLRGELHHLESSLRGEIQRVETTLGDRIDETKRHTTVLFESLRDDIRILAEGFVSLNTKVDSLLPPDPRR